MSAAEEEIYRLEELSLQLQEEALKVEQEEPELSILLRLRFMMRLLPQSPFAFF